MDICFRAIQLSSSCTTFEDELGTVTGWVAQKRFQAFFTSAIRTKVASGKRTEQVLLDALHTSKRQDVFRLLLSSNILI